MGTAAGDAGYFQRGSLFWFTLISFGLGCFTVRAPSGRPTHHASAFRCCVTAGASRPGARLGSSGGRGLGPRVRLCRLSLCGVRAGTGPRPATYSVSASYRMTARSEARRDAAAYFRAARRRPALVTALALGYFAWTVFWPQSIPYQSLGPLGSFMKYLVDHHYTLLRNGYWLTWLIHLGESLYAMALCKYKGITDGRARLLWFLQTFLFGIASLSILIAYRPKQKHT